MLREIKHTDCREGANNEVTDPLHQHFQRTIGERKLNRGVLMLLSDVAFGGIAVQARDQAAFLVKKGILRSLLLLNSVGINEDNLTWYSTSVPTEFIPERVENSQGLRKILNYRSYFAERPESIFHFHCFSQEYMNWQAMLAARLVGKRVVATVHHTVGWTRNSFNPSFLTQRMAWKLAHRLVATTEAGRRLIEERAPKGKTHVVPCIIPLQKPQRSKSKSRAALHLLNSDFVICVVSRLVASKGIADLVNAFIRLRSACDRLRLIIVGDGPFRSELNDLIKDQSGIRLLGYLADISDVYAASDLFALPSYEEGFGMVYAESARYGVPSIASDLPQVREVVVDGETGWIVEPKNIEQIASAIREAYSDPDECRRRGANARTYCQRFEPDAVMSRQIEIYDELLDG
jgi:glycosyltransferase involved in cell wall biosynthesis